MAADPALTIFDLHTSYGTKKAVAGITLQVHRGEVLGLLGPSGGGKTTIVGRRVPGCADQTRARFGCLAWTRRRTRTPYGSAWGVQLESAVLPNRMKVREAMVVFASAYRRHVDPGQLLAEWGLDQQRTTGFAHLSDGQKRRLFTALALLGDPEIVVLDELTSGLGPPKTHLVHVFAKLGVTDRTSAGTAALDVASALLRLAGLAAELMPIDAACCLRWRWEP